MVGLDGIVSRHVRTGRETVPPATMVAIEVVSRLCIGQGGDTSEMALAEHGHRRTGLEDLLGVPDEAGGYEFYPPNLTLVLSGLVAE